MKNFIILFYLLFSSVVYTQTVDIPDINFKNALIEQGVDKNGDGEIQESEALIIDSINISHRFINSLIGIKSFVNLEYLDCNSNLNTELDVKGMKKLITLNCIDNKITSLNIQEVKNLEILYCGNNKISSLELQGLVKLKYLACSSNPLANLNLQGLSSLNNIICESANLKSLNLDGLTDLQFLYCPYNNIKDINLNGLSNLKDLVCHNNQITTLDLKGISNLSRLDCADNLISTLDLSGSTNLVTLACWNNQLYNLNLNGLTNLKYLSCHKNQLANLNLKDLHNLLSLECGDNKLSTIDLESLIKLQSLGIYKNQLISLDISALPNLKIFSVDNNNLISMFIKNGIEKTMSFENNSNLKYICCDDFETDYIKNIANSNGLYNCSVNSYCSFTPGGAFYSIISENKIDWNNNGCEPSDNGYSFLKYSITKGLQFGSTISDRFGHFFIPVQDGTYFLKPNIENPTYFIINPMSFEVTFPDAGDTVIQNICIAPKGVHHDVQVSILPIEPARPGFDAKYKIIFTNRGTQVESGTINFIWNDEVLDFLSSDLPPDLQSKNMLSWNFSDLQPFESRNLNFVLNVNSPIENPSVNIGDILSFEANITTNNFDETPIDNVFDMRQTVVGSLDPNDKTCIEGKNIKPEMIGQYLHYLIRFENTGTYAAKNIVVKDLIDVNVFDIKSLQIIDASHKMFTRIKDNIVEFIFEDIELPFDDNNNDGYVSFKIKTRPNLILGDSLKNKAEIYFDYNLPIVTNEAVSLINNSVNTSELKANNIGFFPNPVKDVVQFLVNDQIETAQIFDLYGKILRSTSINNNQLNIQEFQNGTYMIRLFTGQKIYVAKVVKM